jgi:hypothetical protein
MLIKVCVKPAKTLVKAIKKKENKTSKELVILPSMTDDVLHKTVKNLFDVHENSDLSFYLKYKGVGDLQLTEPKIVLEAARYNGDGGNFNWNEAVERSTQEDGFACLLLVVVDAKSAAAASEHPSKAFLTSLASKTCNFILDVSFAISIATSQVEGHFAQRCNQGRRK